jgi:hypothetical protein
MAAERVSGLARITIDVLSPVPPLHKGMRHRKTEFSSSALFISAKLVVHLIV